MRPFIKNITFAMVLCALTACAGKSDTVGRDSNSVPLSRVVDQLKMELNRYQDYRQKLLAYEAAHASDEQGSCLTKDATLKFKPLTAIVNLHTATSKGAEGSGSADARAGVFVITPSANVSFTKASTQDVTVVLTADPGFLDTGAKAVGAAPPEPPSSADFGLAAALAGIELGLSHVDHTIKPCLELQKLAVNIKFTASLVGTAGAKVKFVVFSAGGSFKSQKDDAQELKLEVEVAGPGTNKPKPGKR